MNSLQISFPKYQSVSILGIEIWEEETDQSAKSVSPHKHESIFHHP